MRASRPLALTILAAGLAAPSEAQIYTRRNRNGVVEATNVPDATDYRLTYPGKGTLIHSRGFRGVYHGEYDAHIGDAAAAFGVPEDLIKAVIQVESEFDRHAVSSKGAQGLMQLMPATARRFGVVDAFEPRQNIFGGTQYLRFLLDLFGDLARALAGYNAGENAVHRHRGIPPYRETQGYVRKVQGFLGGWRPESYVSYAAAPAPPRTPRGKLVPARPRVYYKYRDDKGVVHIAQSPPPEGVAYTMIRALD